MIRADQGDVHHWWQRQGANVEHGWVVDAPQEGRTDVTVRVAIDGAIATSHGDGVWLRLPSGKVLRYDEARAWDALRVPLPLSMVVESDGRIAIRVDTRNARFPVTIDPLVSEEVAAVAAGPITNGGLSGDFNGDGLLDVVAARVGINGKVSRGLDLWEGAPGGLAAAPSAAIEAPESETWLLESGDVDGDGASDVVSFVIVDLEGEALRLDVYRGGATGLAEAPTQTIPLPSDLVTGTSGLAVADVDGDGDDDVILNFDGATDGGMTEGASTVWVLPGGPGGTGADPWTPVVAADNRTLKSILAAGDIDGDGREDLLALERGAGDFTIVDIFAGAANGLVGTPLSSDEFLFLGGVIVPAFAPGDIDGDGHADVGLFLENAALSVYAGGPDGMSDTPAWEIDGEMLGVYNFGRGGSAVADINGDGAHDFTVWAGGGPDILTAPGVTLVFAGSPGDLADINLGAIIKRNVHRNFGFPVLPLNTIGGDELTDIAVFDVNVDPETLETKPGEIVFYAGQAFICEGGDDDGDSVCNSNDNCLSTWNPFQEDLDEDGVGDVCEVGPTDPTGSDGADDTGAGDGTAATGGAASETGAVTSLGGVSSEGGSGSDSAGQSTDTRPVGGCGCNSGDPPAHAGWLAFLLGGWLIRSRRRSAALLVGVTACSSRVDLGDATDSVGVATTTATADETSTSTASTSGGGDRLDVGGLCCNTDGTAVENCGGDTVTVCEGNERCDATDHVCADLCERAREQATSIGCDFRLALLDSDSVRQPCFAALVTNVSSGVANLDVTWKGESLDVGPSAFHVTGVTPLADPLEFAVMVEPVDLSAGLGPGEQVVLALSGACPTDVLVAQDEAQIIHTNIGDSFGVSSDSPVSVHQIHDFGGAAGHMASGTLLLPTHAWSDTYVFAAPQIESIDPAEDNDAVFTPLSAIVALEAGTVVNLELTADVAGGDGVPSAGAGETLTVSLEAGQVLQLAEVDALPGTIATANKPIAAFAGHECSFYPTLYAACDHLEQMLPPAAAAGWLYPGVAPERVAGEPGVFLVTALVDGTAIEFAPEVAEPRVLGRGEQYLVHTSEPFVVHSQADDHPFLFATLMTGTNYLLPPPEGALALAELGEPMGDPDYVLSVPPGQFDRAFTVYVDPTYDVSQLVLVRHSVDAGGETSSEVFGDVTLDCLGVVDGWQDLGFGMQYRRIDVVDQFEDVGDCGPGVHKLEGTGPFAVWAWSWARYTSIGYPVSMGTKALNDVFQPEG